MFSIFKKKTKASVLYTVAFYNLENLFDTEDDTKKLDEDFTPGGPKNWSKKRYNRKLHKLAKTISEIGKDTSDYMPVLLGVAEVENKGVIHDLVNTQPLHNTEYNYVHFNSPDERGIDTALIYNKNHFKVKSSEPIELLVIEENGRRDHTRDILYVHGELNGEEIHVFVNHWPSRRDGASKTKFKRIAAANIIKAKLNAILATNENANFIIMGDFNDGPDAESIQTLIADTPLHNPMQKLITNERGSANYKKNWSLFDQIIVSHNFFNFKKGTHSFEEADIFDEEFLTETKGKYQGTPYRTYVGRKYKGGYSDHFPVYIQLKLN